MPVIVEIAGQNLAAYLIDDLDPEDLGTLPIFDARLIKFTSLTHQ